MVEVAVEGEWMQRTNCLVYEWSQSLDQDSNTGYSQRIMLVPVASAVTFIVHAESLDEGQHHIIIPSTLFLVTK